MRKWPLHTAGDYIGEAEAALNKALGYLESAVTLAGSSELRESINEQVQELRICLEQVEALDDQEAL